MTTPNKIKSKPSTSYLWIEMITLFIVTPLLLAVSVHIAIKLTCVLIAVTYCIMVGRQQGLFVRSNLIGQNWQDVSIPMAIRFIGFILVSSLLVWLFLPDTLFSVVIANPWLWLAVSLFYAVFSVYPQELLYRLFFFKRYQTLISNRSLFIGLNAVLFSLAHSFLLNNLVFLLTFAGGVLFALTYKKSQSLMLASIEHSAYGIWLFTLGLGQQLAFPGA